MKRLKSYIRIKRLYIIGGGGISILLGIELYTEYSVHRDAFQRQSPLPPSMPPLRFSCRQPGAVLAASPAALRCARVAVKECLSYKSIHAFSSVSLFSSFSSDINRRGYTYPSFLCLPSLFTRIYTAYNLPAYGFPSLRFYCQIVRLNRLFPAGRER